MGEQHAPILLLHGFPMTAAMWRHTAAQYEASRIVLAPEAADLVKGAMEEPTMGAMAEAAMRVLNSRAPGRKAVVAGLSMGGYIAMEFARRFPEHLAGLVLCDTRCRADTDEARANRDAMIEAVGERGVVEGTAPLVSKLLSPKAPVSVAEEIRSMVEAGQPEVVVALIRALRDRWDHCAALEAVAQPALVVRGEDDALAPLDVTEEMARRLPNSRLAEIPGAGHVPPLEAPAAFHKELDAFLADNGL